MNLVREAASFEGLIILAVIYFVLNLLSKAGKKQGQSGESPAQLPDEPTATQEEALSLEKILQEIERVKKEKAVGRREPVAQRPAPPLPERRPAPPPMRRKEVADRDRTASVRGTRLSRPGSGPMGRQGKRPLESHEDIEERQSYDDAGSLEVEESLEVLDETRLRPARRERDHDDEAEAVVEQRVKAAMSRNRGHTDRDHQEFHERVTSGEIGGTETEAAKATAARAKTRASNLRRAVVWREILGPPKALVEWGDEP